MAPFRSNFRVLLLPFRSLSATFQSNFREKKLQVLLLPFRPLFFFVTSYCRNMSLPIFPNTTVKRCLAGSLFWDTVLTLFFTCIGTLFWNICELSVSLKCLFWENIAIDGSFQHLIFVGPLSVRPRRPFSCSSSCSCDVRSNESKPFNYSLSMLRRPP